MARAEHQAVPALLLVEHVLASALVPASVHAPEAHPVLRECCQAQAKPRQACVRPPAQANAVAVNATKRPKKAR